MDNVKPLKQPVAFPSLWPVRNWFQVSTAVMHNVPAARGTQKYFFHMKEDVTKGVLMSLILQPKAVVMFNPCDTQANTDRVAAYVNTHRGTLRDIANGLHDGTSMILTGRLHKHENRETFSVYYAIDRSDIYVDEVSIRAVLKLDEHRLDDYLLPMHGVLAEAEVTNTPPKVSCEYIVNMDKKQTVLGLPVASLDERGYNETPVLRSTPRLFNFMSFIINGADKWPILARP